MAAPTQAAMESRFFSFDWHSSAGQVINSMAHIEVGTANGGTSERSSSRLPERTITDDEMHKLRLKPHRFHGDWSYTLEPRRIASLLL